MSYMDEGNIKHMLIVLLTTCSEVKRVLFELSVTQVVVILHIHTHTHTYTYTHTHAYKHTHVMTPKITISHIGKQTCNCRPVAFQTLVSDSKESYL